MRLTALFFFPAAALWPWAMGALGRAMMSPLERAMREAWCGAPLHSSYEILGHCLACWGGSASLLAIGVMVLRARGNRSAGAAPAPSA